MKHAKSNLNVLKKANSYKSPKNSDFMLGSTLRHANYKSPTARNQFFILGLFILLSPANRRKQSAAWSRSIYL